MTERNRRARRRGWAIAFAVLLAMAGAGAMLDAPRAADQGTRQQTQGLDAAEFIRGLEPGEATLLVDPRELEPPMQDRDGKRITEAERQLAVTFYRELFLRTPDDAEEVVAARVAKAHGVTVDEVMMAYATVLGAGGLRWMVGVTDEQ